MLSRRHFLKFIGGLGALGVSTTAYGFSEPVLRLRVTRYNLSPPQWPAGFKLRIAVIADLHACDPWMSLDRIQAIVERTNALNADVIVMLGDYVAGHRKVTRFIPAERMGAGARRAEGAARRARHSRQSRLVGRQDRAARRQGVTIAGRALEAVGHSGLRKRRQAPAARTAVRSGWPGLGDQLAYMPARRFRPVRRIGVDDLGATLAKVTDDAPVVLLAHEPDVARARAGARRAATLRPYPWRPGAAVGLVADRRRPDSSLAYGHIRMNCDVVVSGGLGCSIMPFRLGVPPEIVLVTPGQRRGRRSRRSAALARQADFAQNNRIPGDRGPHVTLPPYRRRDPRRPPSHAGPRLLRGHRISPASSITPTTCASWSAAAPTICG